MEMIDSQESSLNICLVIGGQYPPFPHGGVGSFAVDLSEGLVKRGQKVTCVSFYAAETLKSNQPIYEKINGVDLVRVPRPEVRNFPRLQAIYERFHINALIRKLHIERKFDLIESEDGGGRLALGRLPRVPKVARLHATTIYNDHVLKRKPSRMMHLFERIWLNRADYIVAVSDYVGKITFDLLKKKCDYTVIHYAIDLDHFRPIPGIETLKHLVLFTGVIAPRKGVKELLQAFRQVFEKFPDAELWLIGDNGLVLNGEQYATTLYDQLPADVKKSVKFLGNRSRTALPAILQEAEVCCFPSHVETFGIGIIEAMAMEKPVVYMATGPGPEVVEDGVSGLLADTNSSEDIAQKIIYCLENPEQARKMSVNARRRVLEKFERENWIDRNLLYYRQCVQDFTPKR